MKDMGGGKEKNNRRAEGGEKRNERRKGRRERGVERGFRRMSICETNDEQSRGHFPVLGEDHGNGKRGGGGEGKGKATMDVYRAD